MSFGVLVFLWFVSCGGCSCLGLEVYGVIGWWCVDVGWVWVLGLEVRFGCKGEGVGLMFCVGLSGGVCGGLEVWFGWLGLLWRLFSLVFFEVCYCLLVREIVSVWLGFLFLCVDLGMCVVGLNGS